jgi:hypothetical protein
MDLSAFKCINQITKGSCSSLLQLSRIHDNMACLRAEHAAAVKRAHDMVDMANRAAELVALRSQQSVRHKSPDKFVH